MRGVKRVLSVLLLLVIALIVLVFVLENQQSIVLSFLGWTTSGMPSSVFITGSLILGMLIGPLLNILFRRPVNRHSGRIG